MKGHRGNHCLGEQQIQILNFLNIPACLHQQLLFSRHVWQSISIAAFRQILGNLSAKINIQHLELRQFDKLQHNQKFTVPKMKIKIITVLPHLWQHVLGLQHLRRCSRHHVGHHSVGLQLGPQLLGVWRMGMDVNEPADAIFLHTEINKHSCKLPNRH